MAQQKSIKKNFVMNVVLTMSSFIFPLITFPYVSTILTPARYGMVTFATSIISYFNLFAQLGIPTYGIRAVAQVRDDKEELTRVTHELVFMNFVIGVLSYIVFFILLFTVPRLADEKPLFIITSSMILFNCIGMEWLYKGLEQYTYITVRSILFKFIALIMMFVLIHAKSDYVIYGGISIFAASASNVLNFINAHRYIRFRPIGHYNLKRHLQPVMIFFAMSCATTIYLHLDTIMLGFMKTDTDVGYYNAAVRIKTILTSVVTSLGAVLLPRASYYVNQGKKSQFLMITKKALNFVWIVALPLTVYFILYAKEGIYFLSSRDFTGSIEPMQIIMPTILFIGLTNIMGIQILVPIGKEKYVLYSEVAGAVVDFIINLVLIPQMASSGAAIGTLAAEAVVWIVQYYYTKDIVKDVYKQIRYLPILLGIGIGSLLSLFTKNLHVIDSLRWNSFIVICISGVIFFGAYGITLLAAKEPLVLEMKDMVFRKLRLKKG